MTADNTIVNQINISRLIEVRMRISFHFLSACGPASMSDSNMRFHNGLGNLFNKSIYAVGFLIRFLGTLDELFTDLAIMLTEGHNTGAVISSVF